MVAKANERRVADSNMAIFTKLQNLYTEDLSDRVIGMFTFSNGDEPPGQNALAATGMSSD